MLSFCHIYSYLLQIKTSPLRLWQYWLQTRTSFFACSATSSWIKVGDSMRSVMLNRHGFLLYPMHRYIHFLVFVNKGNLRLFLRYSKHPNLNPLSDHKIISRTKCGLPGFDCLQRMNSLKQTKHKLSMRLPHCDPGSPPMNEANASCKSFYVNLTLGKCLLSSISCMPCWHVACATWYP